ncbi:MAG: CoA pyrophosphatase [Clostridiales bacterium]|nr:CoA pyrophosphatase [Clostridiales bacterium]
MSEYAVLIPYVKIEDSISLLLEVRSEKVRQPGEICFPGGKVEPGENPAETAVRETCEELGVTVDDIKIIANPELEVMADGRKVWSVRASLKLAEIDGLDHLKLSEDEVSEVFLLPVEWLQANQPEHYDLSITSDEELPPKLRGYLAHYGQYRKRGETDYWEYDGHGIWGLTARMIRRLISVESDPSRP